MMKYIMLVFLLFSGCKSSIQTIGDVDTRTVRLDFSKCTTALDAYQKLSVAIPKKFSEKKSADEGMCEYRFRYKNAAVFYLSNNVWFGSRLNLKNRNDINHNAYRRKNLRDTIEISGVQSDGKFWKEKIMGDVLIGYVNASPADTTAFNQIPISIQKEQ